MMHLAILLLALAMAVARAAIGPTVPDRVVALDAMSYVIISIICYLAVVWERWYLIDIALVYALLSFIATVVAARYLRGDFR